MLRTMLRMRAVTKAKARLLWLAFNAVAQLSCVRQSASTAIRSRSCESSVSFCPHFGCFKISLDL